MPQIVADYKQVWMFPPRLEDWVGPDHPARFIRDFVDSLDLDALGFRVPTGTTGRPPYAADLLLKAWLYGYLNRIRSTRKIEKACFNDVGMIWLTGMTEPDHNTLWRFWRDNKKVFKKVFKQTVQVAAKAELVGIVAHAVDGTKIMSACSREGFKNEGQLQWILENLDKLVSDVMTETERFQREQPGSSRLPKHLHDELARKQTIQKALKELHESDRKAVHPRETDARYMKNRRSNEPSYNGQVVADQKSGIIVAQDVFDEPTDNGLLVEMVDQVEETLGTTAQDTVADAGYFSSTQIGLADEKEHSVLVAKSSAEMKSEQDAQTNPYHASMFVHDPDNDVCTCPCGGTLTFLQKKFVGKNKNEVRRYRCREHKTCPHRDKCTKSKHGRTVDISVHQKALAKHAKKRQEPKGEKLLRDRKAIVEPIFAWIKRHLGFRRWTVMGLENVRCQWSFVCTTMNLMKLRKHWMSGVLVF